MKYLDKEKAIFLHRDVSELKYKDLNYEFTTTVYGEGRNNLVQAGYNGENTQHGVAVTTDEYQRFADALFPKRNQHYALKQNPGCVLPAHIDPFNKFRQAHNVRHEDCVRLVFFMEDWQSGHYFEVEEKVITRWKAGDCVKIESDTMHLSANAGTLPKYTFVLTGDKSQLCLD